MLHVPHVPYNEVLTALANVLKIGDSLTGQWDRFFRKKSEAKANKPYRLTAEKVSKSKISVREDGKEVMSITVSDLKKLPPESLILITALETSMTQNFQLWVQLYPQRNVTADVAGEADVNRQLKRIGKEMCADFEKMFKYCESIGRQLEDHYEHVRFICKELAGGSET